MRLRLPLISLLALVLAAAVAPSAALAKPRMLVGLQDDPSLRWRPDRKAAFNLAQKAHTGIVRTTVYWSRIAETRPRDAANPFDRAYRFSDLDEFVRNAGMHGMEVMLTIWGTPKWANHGAGQNHAPVKLADLRKFAQALANRYSGRHPGYPFVRYYTVWNESNLGLFLSPQYNPRTKKAVAPRIYAGIYRAAYAGIKAGSPHALVGIGETSARGRDRYLGQTGVQETESPGRFAKRLAGQRPKLRFDAWSHHPYPTTLRQRPTQRSRWPNVTLTQLPRFEDRLVQWFHRKTVPIWITEYGYQTRPAKAAGVTTGQQAAYLRTALRYAAGDPNVDVFIWFILRDDPTSDWKSGLVSRNGKKKPSYATFAKAAAKYDGREPQITLDYGAQYPLVRFPALELWSRSGTGAKVGLTVAVYSQATARNLRLVKVTQPLTRIGYDGWISFHAPLPRATARNYSVEIHAGDIHGNKIQRSIYLHVKPKPLKKKR
jgi:Cellulase (glycosyl hydrolase family 5)